MSLLTNLKEYFVGMFTGGKATNSTSSARASGEDEPCRYRLDTDSSHTFLLPDGRRLGYALYGSTTGPTIIFCPGLGASRMEAAIYHDSALAVGACIIAVDRPGLGWSSPQPNRTLLDHPEDLRLLSEHLGLESYAVMGVSGGGPYALACAATLPAEKLKAVAVVCGLGPPDIGMKGANIWNWLGLTYGFLYAPVWLGRWWMKKEPIGRLDLTKKQRLDLYLHPDSRVQKVADNYDLDIMHNEDFLRLAIRSGEQAYSQGHEWAWKDGTAMCRDWGFRIQDIREDLPVQLWYGKYDNNVPINHGIQIAARLGGRAQFRAENAAHCSIAVNYAREILEQLVSKMN